MRKLLLVFGVFIGLVGFGFVGVQSVSADYCAGSFTCSDPNTAKEYSASCYTHFSNRSDCNSLPDSGCISGYVATGSCTWVTCGGSGESCCTGTDPCDPGLVCGTWGSYNDTCVSDNTVCSAGDTQTRDVCANDQYHQETRSCNTSATPNQWGAWTTVPNTTQTCSIGCDSNTNQCIQEGYCINTDCCVSGGNDALRNSKCWGSYTDYANGLPADATYCIVSDNTCPDNTGASCRSVDNCSDCTNGEYCNDKDLNNIQCCTGTCHPTQNSCVGQGVSPCGASQYKWIDNCGGIDCNNNACPPTDNGGNNGCTPNWVDNGCGVGNCGPFEMSQSDTNCGLADRCVVSDACFGPTCSITGTDSVNLSVNSVGSYAATGSTNQGTFTRLDMFLSPTSTESWTSVASCNADSCSASIDWSNFGLGQYYVVCNGFNDVTPQGQPSSQCSGNPFSLPTNWSDCDVNGGDAVSVSVIDNRTCTVSLSTSNIDQGGSVTIDYAGNPNCSSSNSMLRVFLEKRDGSMQSPTPSPLVAQVNSLGNYYSEITEVPCNGYGGCSGSVTVTVSDPGEYYVHCDLPQPDASCSGVCSGNPFCSYESVTPSVTASQSDCTGWQSCSNTDNAYLSVRGVVSGTVYRDDDNSCSSGTGYGGVSVSLYDSSNNLVGSATTAADGSYSIYGDVGSDYSLAISAPNGYLCSTGTCNSLGCSVMTGVAVPSTGNDFYLALHNDPWWQVGGAGELFSGSTGGVSVSSNIPSNSYYLLNSVGSVNMLLSMLSTTPPDVGSGSVSLLGYVANGTGYEGRRYDFEFWKKHLDLGVSPTDNWPGSTNLDNKPSSNGVFYHSGSASVPGWTVSSGESFVVLVDGDLSITNDVVVDNGGFLAFVVSGDITIDPSVTSVQGVYITDGNFVSNSASDGASVFDSQLVVEGTVVAWGSVELHRDLGTSNTTTPAERFVYRPDFLQNFPDSMKVFLMQWREVAPGSF